VREHVAPARLRELGEAQLDLNAAVRAGAIALDRLASVEAAAYRRYYLHSTGQAAVTGAAQLEAAFVRAFPLPAELEAGLAASLDRALAGI
jgi:hypothetical protein